MILQIRAQALAERLAGPRPPRLVDVREPWEWALGRLPGAELIPLGTLPGALAHLAKDEPIVLYCHHGVRSQHAAKYLEALGFLDLGNLAGGIDAWSTSVDPAVARY